MSNTQTDPQVDELMAEMMASGLMGPPAEISVEDHEEIEGLDEIADELIVQELAPAAVLTEEVLASLAGELEAESERHEVYAEQEVTADFVEAKAPTDITQDSEEIDEGDAIPATIKKARTPRAASGTTRTARFMGRTAGEYVATVSGITDIGPLVEGLPKKVKDKAANLVDHIKAGKTLSVYTQTAIGLLRDGSVVTNKGMTEAFLAQAKRSDAGHGYSIGTARSQAGQQLSLLTKLGVIDAAGRPNPDNWMAQALSLVGSNPRL